MSKYDSIIIGSGIHKASNPTEMALKYAKISWDALIKRSVNSD